MSLCRQQNLVFYFQFLSVADEQHAQSLEYGHFHLVCMGSMWNFRAHSELFYSPPQIIVCSFTHQCAVRAALEGRVLVLDGIEKAERNVLPILNNLLENREMQLDDGRFLVAPEKYDKLSQRWGNMPLIWFIGTVSGLIYIKVFLWNEGLSWPRSSQLSSHSAFLLCPRPIKYSRSSL